MAGRLIPEHSDSSVSQAISHLNGREEEEERIARMIRSRGYDLPYLLEMLANPVYRVGFYELATSASGFEEVDNLVCQVIKEEIGRQMLELLMALRCPHRHRVAPARSVASTDY